MLHSSCRTAKLHFRPPCLGHGPNKPGQCSVYFIINWQQKAWTILNMFGIAWGSLGFAQTMPRVVILVSFYFYVFICISLKKLTSQIFKWEKELFEFACRNCFFFKNIFYYQHFIHTEFKCLFIFLGS